jgi:hypothetical protein
VANNLNHGVFLQPFNNTTLVVASFNRVEAYSNGQNGIFINGQFAQGPLRASVFECVAEGNGGVGIHASAGSSLVVVKILRSDANNNTSSDINAETALVQVGQTGVGNWTGNVTSYGDNYSVLPSPGIVISRE